MSMSGSGWWGGEAFPEAAEAIRVHQWLSGRPRPQEEPAGEAVRYHRKSATALTTEEQRRLVAALNGLITANNTDHRRWGKFPDIHRDTLEDIHGTIWAPWPGSSREPIDVPPTTHRAWAPLMQFLPWHRMFLRWFEQELQMIDPGVSLPYWDWTVDRSLPSWVRSFTSAVQTPTRNGGSAISITRTAAARTGTSGPSTGLRDFDSLPIATEITTVRGIPDFQHFSAELEMQHNRPHVFVGDGSLTMGSLETSAADIAFYVHHAQIDRIWALWQIEREITAAAASATGAGLFAVVGGAATAVAIRSLASHPRPAMRLALPSGMAPAAYGCGPSARHGCGRHEHGRSGVRLRLTRSRRDFDRRPSQCSKSAFPPTPYGQGEERDSYSS